jgi:hypothetical protein
LERRHSQRLMGSRHLIDISFPQQIRRAGRAANDNIADIANQIESRHIGRMSETLDLDPEWGAIDLIEELEATFGFKMGDDEAESCCTVGDVYNVVCAHTPEWELQDGNCASSIVFYRLRRVLRPADKRLIRPSTHLTSLRQSPTKLFDSLAKGSELRLPSHSLTWLGNIGALMLFGGTILAVIALFDAQWLIAGSLGLMAAIGSGVVWLDPGKFPKGINTIGELVNRTVPLNSKLLKEMGGRPDNRWSILTAMASEHGSLEPSAISPDTYLHKKSLQDACAA